MKITDVRTFVVGNPPPGIGGRYFIFVKLTTDGNVVGWGEAYNATFSGHVTARMIEDMAERYLVGHDPHDIEILFRRCSSSGFTQRPDVSAMGCFSALEIACWDIIGKEAGKPVYKLLGGQVHETLRSYTYLYPHTGSVHTEDVAPKNVYNDPDMAAECATLYVKQGFNAVKLDPAGPWTAFDGHQPRLIDIDLSARMVKAIRDLTHGEGAHKTLDASSAPEARAAAVRAVRSWGTACFVGERGQVTLDVSPDLLRRQVTLVGSWTFSKQGQAECAEFIADRKIDVERLFTHRFTLEQADEAYRLFDTQTTGKGVILPS